MIEAADAGVTEARSSQRAPPFVLELRGGTKCRSSQGMLLALNEVLAEAERGEPSRLLPSVQVKSEVFDAFPQVARDAPLWDRAVPWLLLLQAGQVIDAKYGGFGGEPGDKGIQLNKDAIVDLLARNALFELPQPRRLRPGGGAYEREDLSRAGFGSMELAGRRFDGKTMHNAIFSGSDLTGASFRGTDLTGAAFFFSDLTAADFTDAKVNGVIWTASTCPDGKRADSESGCLGRLALP